MVSLEEDDRDNLGAQALFDLYLHDYLVKKKLHNTAEIFRTEANVVSKPIAFDDSFDGLLKEWWTIFYDFFNSKQLMHQEAQTNSSVRPVQRTQNQLQNAYPTMPILHKNQQRPGQFPVVPAEYNMLSRPPAYILPPTTPEQQQYLRQPISDLNQRFLQQQIRNQVQQPVQNGNVNYNTVANPTDITVLGAQKGTFPMTESFGAGVNQGVNQVPSNGWPSNKLMQTPNNAQQFPVLTDHRHQNLSWPSNKLTQTPNCTQQFRMLTDQRQQNLLGQPLSLTPANFYGQRLILPKSCLSGKDGQVLVQTKQTEDRQTGPDNGIKRRRLPYSRAGDKILGNANAEVDKPEDEIESFLSADDNEGDKEDAPFGSLIHRSTTSSKTDEKGFTFKEIGCLRLSKSKVLCCQFSSDGGLLASAGHEKKVFIWNMETYDYTDSSEGHSSLITDVRFRPNSTVLATSSFDRTLQIWDATYLSRSLFKLLGHAEHVMALDFHPRKEDLLCSCDSNNEIRLWNVNRGDCIRVSKGATNQVRFQPQSGKLLATASGNSVNVMDVENNNRIQFCLKGHAKEVLSLCWDISGKYIASVSEDSARVWSLVSGGICLHELNSNGNKFQSCAFHPGYSQLLMVGSYQSLELWNPIDGNKTRSVSAHTGLISALAGSPATDTIASASHDRCVKLWK